MLQLVLTDSAKINIHSSPCSTGRCGCLHAGTTNPRHGTAPAQLNALSGAALNLQRQPECCHSPHSLCLHDATVTSGTRSRHTPQQSSSASSTAAAEAFMTRATLLALLSLDRLLRPAPLMPPLLRSLSTLLRRLIADDVSWFTAAVGELWLHWLVLLNAAACTLFNSCSSLACRAPAAMMARRGMCCCALLTGASWSHSTNL